MITSYIPWNSLLYFMIISYIPWNSLLYFQTFFINQNKNYIFMIKKDWRFCGKILQSVAILHKKIENCHFHFSWL